MPPSTRNTRRPSSDDDAGRRYADKSDIDEHLISSIHASLSSLLLNDKFSDMTIRCDGRTFKAHRAVVCTQSSFFDKALSGAFKESTSQTVDLHDDDPDTVERFLEFLYTGTYHDKVNHTTLKPSEPALLTPEEVKEGLKSQPGVIDDLDSRVDDLEPAEMNDERKDETANAETEADSGEQQLGNYQPPSDSEEPGEEPDEEYEEYEEESGDDKDSDDGEDSTHPHPVDPAALKALAIERGDGLVALRVYIMADKYDVPALRLLARDRFCRAIEPVWAEMGNFPDIIDEIYSCTSPTETGLREFVCRLVANGIMEKEIRERMGPVMAKHGEFAVGVLEYMIHLSTFAWP